VGSARGDPQAPSIATAHLKLVFAERGEADFTEFVQAAVRALGSAERRAICLLALDYRIKHILVDEFQDTSISQWSCSSASPRMEEGDGRTLFVVGDRRSRSTVSRSRGRALLHARREGPGQRKTRAAHLTTNFRSQGKLVDFSTTPSRASCRASPTNRSAPCLLLRHPPSSRAPRRGG